MQGKDKTLTFSGYRGSLMAQASQGYGTHMAQMCLCLQDYPSLPEALGAASAS